MNNSFLPRILTSLSTTIIKIYSFYFCYKCLGYKMAKKMPIIISPKVKTKGIRKGGGDHRYQKY